MTKVFIFVLTVLCFALNNCEKLLIVVPTPSFSHQVVFKPLVLELIRRGHEVTIIATDPIFKNDVAPPNLIEIDVHNISYNILNNVTSTFFLGTDNDPLNQVKIAFKHMPKVFEAQMKDIFSKEIKKYVLNNYMKYDLLIIEAWIRSTLAFTHVFNVPTIQISSFNSWVYNNDAIGIPTHPLIYPAIDNLRLYNLTIWEKISELYCHWRVANILRDSEQEENSKLNELFGPDMPSINKLSNNVQMMMLNSHPMWANNIPVPKNVMYIRGIHIAPSRELPKDLQSYMDSSQNGVIYISFGTNCKSYQLPLDKIKLILKVFSQLPYDVIWKWDNETLFGKSHNIKIVQWLPQPDLLKHPNLKLFITQGGLQSTDEAITAGVPLIGIPMLGDQWSNTEKYVHYKIGKQLLLTSLTEDQFRDAIETVINDKSYRENIIRLRTLMDDLPMPPLERAVSWIEFLLRYGSSIDFRSPAANLSWAEYYEVNLILTTLSILFITLALMLFAIYCSWKIISAKLFTVSKGSFRFAKNQFSCKQL